MEITLTPQQSAALHSSQEHPISVVDGANSEKFYLVPAPTFLHLQGLAEQSEEWCQQQLQRVIQEGIDSPEIPAAEAFARLRAVADGLARKAP